MQRSTVRQKDASETEGESIQNSDQASNAIRGETWATTKRQEKRIEVTEMRMLRWTCGVTRQDKIRNEHIRGTTSVAQASKKITERRLIWYGHVMRRDGEHIGPTEQWRIQRWSQGGFPSHTFKGLVKVGASKGVIRVDYKKNHGRGVPGNQNPPLDTPLLRKVLRADIPGKRKRGRPKTRWKDVCQRDLQSTGLRAGEETDRAMWRRKIICHTGDPT